MAHDQQVLVQAGAGGVGHMSVQIARLAGARVAATVSPGPKTDLAASLGAELCIDYTTEDVGGRTFTACFSLTRPYCDLVSNVESPWADEAIQAMHERNLRVSFTWMPAPMMFGWDAQRERQRGIGKGSSDDGRLTCWRERCQAAHGGVKTPT